ncbi:MAG: hypothetical protein ACHWZW_03070 [Spirulina sp.]
MWDRVQIQDRMEVRAGDLNAMQDYAKQGIEALFFDGIGSGKYYSGLEVSQISPTEVRVAPGRYWAAGQCFARLENLQVGIQAETIPLINHLPAQYERAIALCVYGEVRDTNVEPRDFLIDLVTQATEPAPVPINRMQLALVGVYPGVESPQPQIPIIPSGVLHFCTVWLQPTGIARIEMVEANRVPSTADCYLNLDELLRWKSSIEALLESLRSELAALYELIKNFSPLSQLRLLGLDIARLKEWASLPDTYSAYGSDWFLEEEESDLGYSGYDARIDYGLLFPISASASSAIALLSPNDSSVRVSYGRVLPTYTNRRRFGTMGYTGKDIGLTVEQQSFELRSFEISQYVHKYGWSYNDYGAWWSQNYNQGKDFSQGSALNLHNPNDKITFAYNWTLQWNNHWTLQPVTQQYLAPTTTTVVGAMVAQTFMAPASMWLTAVDLHFTKIDSSGSVTLAVCRVSETGEPLLGQVVTQATLSHSQLRLHSQATQFALPPAFLYSGQRYALCVISQGAHRLATVNGKEFTEGTLFTSTSGSFFEGDLTQDLLFAIYSAHFTNPRTVVALQPLSLSGGFSDLEINAPAFVPQGTDLIYEIQVGGIWHPLTEPTYYLQSLPDSVPLRVVFLGTTDIQPALELTADAIQVSRPKTTLTHISTERTLASPSSDITVKVKAHGFNGAVGQTDHDLVAKLVLPDGALLSPAASSLEVQPDGATVHVFEFSPGTAINTYRVRLEGFRSGATVPPFVIVERLDIAV